MLYIDVVLAFLMFLYWCAPVFINLQIMNCNNKLSFSNIISLSLNLPIIAYLSIYFLLRVIYNDVELCIFFLHILPPLHLLYIVFLIRVRHIKIKWLVKNTLSIFRSKYSFMFIALLGIYFFLIASLLRQNGYDDKGNLILHDQFATEVVSHLSIVSSLNNNIFPVTMNYLSNDLSFYHYFPNLFLHVFSSATFSKNTYILYNYFFLPLMFILLAVNVLSLALFMFRNIYIGFIAVFLSILCYDISSLILWLRGVLIDHSWLFGRLTPDTLSVWTPILTQFQLFYNPSFLLSTVLLLFNVIITKIYYNNPSKIWMMISAISWAFIFKAKITTYLIGMGGLFLFGLYLVFVKRRFCILNLFSLSLLLSLPFWIMSYGHQKNSITFSNWYFPNNFAYRAHLIDQSTHETIKDFGYADSFWKNIIFIFSCFIYYIGLLNFRIISFLNNFKRNSMFLKDPIHIFIWSLIMIGIMAFIFIANSVSKYDSMWFFLVIIFLLNIYTAERLDFLMNQSKLRYKLLLIVAGVIIFFSTISLAWPGMTGGWKKPYLVSKSKLEAFSVIKNSQLLQPIMTKYYHLYPEFKDDENNLLSAFTAKKVICEGIGQDFYYRTGDHEIKKKITIIRNDIDQFYTTNSDTIASRIIDKYNIGYVYIEKPDSLFFPADRHFSILYSSDEIKVLIRK